MEIDFTGQDLALTEPDCTIPSACVLRKMIEWKLWQPSHINQSEDGLTQTERIQYFSFSLYSFFER